LTNTIVLIDLVHSTESVRDRGTPSGWTDIGERLQTLVQRFKAVDPSLRQEGDFHGDGVLLIGTRTLDLIECAVRSQSVWSGLAARIAITLGTVEQHASFGATAMGINLARRLLERCPIAGVVLGGGAAGALIDHPQLQQRAVKRESNLKDFGSTRYMIIDGPSGWARLWSWLMMPR